MPLPRKLYQDPSSFSSQDVGGLEAYIFNIESMRLGKLTAQWSVGEADGVFTMEYETKRAEINSRIHTFLIKV